MKAIFMQNSLSQKIRHVPKVFPRCSSHSFHVNYRTRIYFFFSFDKPFVQFHITADTVYCLLSHPPFVISGSQTNRCANHWESEMANGFSMANRFYNSPGTIRHSPCIYSLMVGGGHSTGFVAVGGWLTWMETRGFTQQLFWICISPLKVFCSSSSSPCCWSDNRQEEEKLAIMLIVIAKIHKEEIVLGLDGTRERAAVLGRQLWRFSYQSLYCLLVEWGCVGKVWPT